MEHTELAGQKKQLRSIMRSKIAAFCNGDARREEASASAASCFLSSDTYRNADIICAFISLPNEIDTKRIIAKAIIDGKRVAVPRIIPGTNEMDFYFLDGVRHVEDQLVQGEYGIREPLETAEKIDVLRFPSGTVIMVPGLAFSRKGERLGKGRGFYDRYAGHIKAAGKKQPAAYAGICFSFQIADDVPHDDLDVRLNCIACDSGMISCGNL